MKDTINSLFEKAKEREYCFNAKALDSLEVESIRHLAQERRSTYGKAPIGRKVFQIIAEREPELVFQLMPFTSTNIDAMLLIPNPKGKRAYVILNQTQLLINQIFASAHEYYHYICDYEQAKKNPIICDAKNAASKSEIMANRFAAEFLLPSDALISEIAYFRRTLGCKENVKLTEKELAILCGTLVLKYEFPLKAVMYRLAEEKHIDNIDVLMEKYDFINAMLLEIQKMMKHKRYLELFETKNDEIMCGNLYNLLEQSYHAGLVTKDEVEDDAQELGLDMDVMNKITMEDEDEDEDKKIDAAFEAWGKKK